MTQMTEQEVIRKIGLQIPMNCISCRIANKGCPHLVEFSFNVTKPCKFQMEITNQIFVLIKQAGYVQLSEDQSLPLSGPYSLREAEIVR